MERRGGNKISCCSSIHHRRCAHGARREINDIWKSTEQFAFQSWFRAVAHCRSCSSIQLHHAAFSGKLGWKTLSRQRSAKRTFRDDKWLFCLLKCASSELKYPRWHESCSVNRCSLNLSAAGNDYFAAHLTFAQIAAVLSLPLMPFCGSTHQLSRVRTLEFAQRKSDVYLFFQQKVDRDRLAQLNLEQLPRRELKISWYTRSRK